MYSFVDLDRTFGNQPLRLGAILSRIDVGRGREELYRDQVPTLLYLCQILAEAYLVFEQRVAAEQRSAQKLTKQERVRDVLEYAPVTFTIDAIRRSLPGISDQTIRMVLSAMRREGLIQFDDTGRNATWTRRG